MTPRRRLALLALPLALPAAWLAGPPAAHAIDPFAAPPTAPPLRSTLIAEGLEHPWAIAFLPDFATSGRMLVSERPGRLRIVTLDGKRSAPISGLPPVYVLAQGGLLDVALHPRFAENRLVYWSYAEPQRAGANARTDAASTAVARGRLDVDKLALSDVQVIFRQAPKFASPAHFGSRLAFARDGTLFVTLGDRYYRKDDARTLDTHHGKIVHLSDDGGVPPGNPYAGQRGALPQIWSVGHRNLQGAAIHPRTGELWVHEHGPEGGDELNIARAGADHGWPIITHGRDYLSKGVLGEGTARTGVVAPLTYWVPSIGPSGMAFVDGTRYPQWRGQLLVGALRARQLIRLELDGDRVVREHRLDVGARVRDVRQAPDGWVYLLTDEADGRILRVEP